MIKKESAKVVEKKYFNVVVECMLPATVTYRVLAETPEQAAELYRNISPISVKHKLAGKKDNKLKVYLSGSLMILFIKNLLR